MDVDSLKFWTVVIAPAVLGAFHWFRLYHGVRVDRFRLSSQRTKRFYALVQSGAWRKAPPVGLQMAFIEAYGYELDDRHIRFALGRHHSLSLFRDLRRCAGMIRLDDEQKGFKHWRGLKSPRRTYRAHGQIAFALGFVPYVLFMLSAAFLATIFSKETVALIMIVLVAWCLTTMFLANGFESAHRVVDALDDLYPAWNPVESVPASASEPPSSDGVARSRRTRAKKVAEPETA